MASLNIYKVLLVVFLGWAVVSSIFAAYYYNQFIDVLRSREALASKLEDVEETLAGLSEKLAKLGEQVEQYNESYISLLARMRAYLERSVAIVVIDYGNGTIVREKVYFIEGLNNTVFNLTLAVAELNYTYYPYLDDYFINGINGVYNRAVNATSGYYWVFYVNFRLSDKGSYQTKVYDGDIIIWNYTYVSWG